MPQYHIIDQETGDIYQFDLSEEEYHRASKDLIYCTQLLEQAKAGESNNNIVQQEMQSDFNEVCNDGFRWADEPIKLLLATYKQHENLLHKGKIMDEMFRNKPWVTPILILDFSSSMSPASPSDSSSSSSSNIVMAPSSQSTSSTNERYRKRKKQKVTQDTVLEELLTIMKDNKNERKMMHDEAVIRQDRLLNILEKLANK